MPSCIDPLRDPLWLRLIERRPSTPFHSPEWFHVLADTYSLDIRAQILLDEAGEPLAGLPYCLIDDMRGKRVVILPFSDYCDPLLVDSAQWDELSGPLFDEGCPIYMRCLQRQDLVADGRFECYRQARWHGLDLSPDLDTLWNQLNGSARRAINKARQCGVEVLLAQGEDGLRAFFDMHLHVRKYKYRLLAQPYGFFEHIWQQFVERQSGFIALAVYQGKPIGAIWFLEWQDGLYYKFNASLADFQSVRPNDYLLWQSICHAKETGKAHLDFGLSDWDQEGLVRYKRKYADQEGVISFLRYVPDGMSQGSNEQLGSLLPRLTELFTHESVPDRITERAGELLYRYFV